MEWVAAETGTRYGESDVVTKAHRVLADHGRAMTFLVADGVTPSNEGRGYVLRRVIRRAVLHGHDVGLESFLPRLADVVVEQMGGVYPELVANGDTIRDILAAEETRFSRTLAVGEGFFEEAAAKGAVSRRGRVQAPRHLRVSHRADARAGARARPHRGRGGLRAAHGGAARALAGRRGDGRRPRAGRRLRARGRVRDGLRRLREDRRPHAGRGARGARGRPLPRQAARVPLLPRGRGPGIRPGVDREGRAASRARAGLPLRRGPGAPLRGRGLRRRRPRPGRRAVEGPLPDDGEPHGHPPPAPGAPGGARGPRAPGRLGGPPGQAPLRLHALRGAHPRGARARRGDREPARLREPSGARVPDTDRGGPHARGHDALRREVRRHRPRARGRRRLARALRRDARPLDRGDRPVRDPLGGLHRLGRAQDRGRDLGRGVRVPARARPRGGRAPPRARERAQGGPREARGVRRVPRWSTSGTRRRATSR